MVLKTYNDLNIKSKIRKELSGVLQRIITANACGTDDVSGDEEIPENFMNITLKYNKNDNIE